MAVKVKILQPDERHLLQTAGPDVFDDPLDARAAEEFLRDPRHHIAVALDDGVVVGFATAVHYVHPDKPFAELWINEVGVASTVRGRGIGKAVLEALLNHARQLGCREAWVLTERDNQAAMRLYSRSGGREAPGDQVMFEFPLTSRADPPATLVRSGLAPVNGIGMYYEVHGRRDGVPLVLLHGGGSTIDVTFSRVLPLFAANRMVIALEEQGHGRTADREAPVAFDSSADDVAELLRHLGIDRADLFGFSSGASVALQVAIRHPDRVRKLVFASAMTRRDGAQPQVWEFMKNADFSNMPQLLKEAFLRVNPDPQKLRIMHDKDAARMQNFVDVPDEAVRSVRGPTLIVLGDRDIVRLEHAVELTRLIDDARLLILPGGHGDYLGEAVAAQRESSYPELTVRMIEEFLGSP
jgi:pimeloyl-ACP methyl ester carboxylesterase/ribosomal protein S18 acetylase RimI-like enzyme